MSKVPTVSVLIPVFNDQDGLDRCVAALARQSYPPDSLEVIIIDNGSVPAAHANASSIGSIRVISCRTPGSYAARNAGVGIASGEVLAFTDADCVPEKDWIAAGVNAIQRSAFRAVIGGEVSLALSTHPSATERYQYLTGFMQRENIELRGFSATANLFVGHSQMKRVGLFDEKLLSGGDREWCWRAQQAGYVLKYAPDVVVSTFARKSLISAIRQARRVAGGRSGLYDMQAAHVTSTGIEPHRTGLSAAKWILNHPELSTLSKLQVLCVACTLKLVSVIETFRLRISDKPERR
jgi:cellulose synthase/poly-beta-1,6-N-acetylglucosamine synthase-like glycosyltransferase